MKETADIINFYHAATLAGKKTALATVVLVEGSSYRRPGASMLVTEDGAITGTISGGCLESDAIKKGLLAISQQQNKLVAYNSMDDEDITDGIQLGCNGIVYILFEPVDAAQENNPVALLEKAYLLQQPAALVTIFNKDQPKGFQQGTILLSTGGLQFTSTKNSSINIGEDVEQSLLQQRTTVKHYTAANAWAFINILKPAIQLIIAGAGNDAFPLVEMANVLGWKVSIIDGRKTYANAQRFAGATTVKAGKPAELLPQLTIHERTAVVLLTHNYQYDIAMLRLLLQRLPGYIGVLGPKKKLNKMLEELQLQGSVIGDKEKEKIYGPAGLDVGAETPEEIALSIIAEIKAVMAKRAGGTLRDKNGFIHDHEKPNSFTGGFDKKLPHFSQELSIASSKVLK